MLKLVLLLLAETLVTGVFAESGENACGVPLLEFVAGFLTDPLEACAFAPEPLAFFRMPENVEAEAKFPCKLCFTVLEAATLPGVFAVAGVEGLFTLLTGDLVAFCALETAVLTPVLFETAFGKVFMIFG